MKGFMEIDISRLRKADWNYKKDNPEILKKLIENIRKNGQIENIIVRELEKEIYEVVNGNHRVDALLSVGIEKVYCFNLGEISLEQAKRIAIETNETRFETDAFIISDIMKELSESFGISEIELTMPFTDDEINNMIKITDFVIEEEPVIDEGNTEEKEKKILECPNCGYAF